MAGSGQRSEVWVVVEQWRGAIPEITYEVLALGREVAGALGGSLQAVALGAAPLFRADGEAPSLGAADGVLAVQHPALAEPVPEVHALALAQLIKERAPQVVLIPQTNVTMELGSLVAARLGLPFINLCRDVQVVDGRPVARCVLYGGKVEATVAPAGRNSGAGPAILGILPGSRPQEQGRAGGTPAVTTVPVDLPAESPVRLQGYTEPAASGVDITRENVLVGVGRGIQRPENVALAQELAAVLGGAVCGSRPVIDQGWLSPSRQVGTSGMIVQPAVYLAFGISGAPEHVEGMKRAALIIAVNTDPRAPIYSVAHYGAVADALEVLPALTEAVRGTRKAA